MAALQSRKSPEVRLTPMTMLVFDVPFPIPSEYASRIGIGTRSYPRQQNGSSEALAKRATPLAREMVEAVPQDGVWYLAAICYSHGQAPALASHVGRGGYGPDIEIAVGPIPNKNIRGMGREHAVLIRRTSWL